MFTNLRPVSNRLNDADTATVLRRSMLGLAAVGIIATTVELATLRHWTSTTQLIPWVVLGVLALGVAVLAFGGSRRTVRIVQIIAVLAAISGLYGLFIHVQANYDAAILDYRYTDRWPQMSLMSKIWAASTGQVGPSPVMAPAVLTQCGICLALATFRHPLLARSEAPAVAVEPEVQYAALDLPMAMENGAQPTQGGVELTY
jgi:hypothetical protein